MAQTNEDRILALVETGVSHPAAEAALQIDTSKHDDRLEAAYMQAMLGVDGGQALRNAARNIIGANVDADWKAQSIAAADRLVGGGFNTADKDRMYGQVEAIRRAAANSRY